MLKHLHHHGKAALASIIRFITVVSKGATTMDSTYLLVAPTPLLDASNYYLQLPTNTTNSIAPVFTDN